MNDFEIWRRHEIERRKIQFVYWLSIIGLGGSLIGLLTVGILVIIGVIQNGNR